MTISKHIRSNAAYLLARTWELRLEHGVPEFAPILQKLWRARGKMVPNFGTMLGFSEIFLLSEDTESRWYDFLLRDDLDEDEIYSLQEFIFGLTYEEIGSLRSRMEKAKRTSVGRDELGDYLQKKKAYPEYEMDDPRDLYRSFRDRKNHGRYRKRARLDGPKKTFEEYLMCFLLTQPEVGQTELPGE
jgi:hypothetical protein